VTSRGDYKQVALDRLQDAHILFDAKRYSAAYYMVGYVIECALKARIAQRFARHTIPERQLLEGVYQHDLEKLLTVAGLRSDLNAAMSQNASLRNNWNIVKNWKVDSRYIPRRSRAEARDMLTAVSDPVNGVLSWIQAYW